MKKLLPIFFTLLASCASGPQLNTSVINIDKQDLSNYWITNEHTKSFSTVISDGNGKCLELMEDTAFENDKYAIFTYLIDSKGHIYDRKYSKIIGEPKINIQFMNRFASGMGAIDATKYFPSSTNTNRTPVRVQAIQYIVEKQGNCF